MQRDKFYEEYLKEQEKLKKDVIDTIEHFFKNAEKPCIDLASYNAFFTRIVFVIRLYDDSKGLEYYVDQKYLEDKEVIDTVCRCSESNPVVFTLFSNIIYSMSERQIDIAEYLLENFYSFLSTRELYIHFEFEKSGGLEAIYQIIKQLRCFETRRLVLSSRSVFPGSEERCVEVMKDLILRTKITEVEFDGEFAEEGVIPDWIKKLQVVANTPLSDRNIPLESIVKSAAKTT